MAPAADEARLAFAARQTLICVLTAWAGETFQTPEIALTVYLVFFLNHVDRTSSLVANIILTVLITIIISLVILTTMIVIDQPALRFGSIGLLSFGFLFLASASKLRPIGAIVALIVGYALDLLGTAHAGEVATRALLYAWLFIGIPAGVSIVVNLFFAPSPRRLVERTLAYRLRVCARRLIQDDPRTRLEFKECLEEGPGEVASWLRLVTVEKTAPFVDLQALRRAQDGSIGLLVLTDLATSRSQEFLPHTVRERLSGLFAEMATVFESGHYPVGVDLPVSEEEAALPVRAAILMAQLRLTLPEFAEAGPEERSIDKTSPPAAAKSAPAGFFLPDAFNNPEHLHYALKTTFAALLCYVAYSILDWPSIHTCFITCYIVALPTAAESIQKLTLRILGCVGGAAAGIACLVFVMPGLTSIGALLAVVSVGAFVAAWIAGGRPSIAYAGFQVAFAFFLCVIQGPAPAFDMVVARDRVIGILFGIVVSYGVSAYVWPVSVANRIDPGIVTLLRKMSASLTAPTVAIRRTVGAVALAGLRDVGQDLGLLSYEPRSLRPAPIWVERRAQTLDRISALIGPLQLAASSNMTLGVTASHRLAEAASLLSPGTHEAPPPPCIATIESSSHVLWQWVEGPLIALEEAIAADVPSLGETSMRLLKVFTSVGKGLALGCLAGCATSALDLAPAHPDEPWVPNTVVPSSATQGYTLTPNTELGDVPTPAPVDSSKPYPLPELIDIAESSNPLTRITWNDARRIALGAGITESAYLPQLTASAIGGYQASNGHTAAPGVPPLGNGSASGTVEAISLQWLLFDFGERAAVVDMAKQASTISNIAFTAAHQQVIYAVSQAFYALAAAQSRVTTAEQSFQDSQAIQTAALARYQQGVGTVIEVDQSRLGLAQAEFARVQAAGVAQDAHLALLTAMGVSPLTNIKIADVSGRSLPPSLPPPAQAVIAQALSRRPDVQSAYAAEQASLAHIRAARAEFMPKVFLAGNATYSTAGLDVTALPAVGQQSPTVNVSGSHFGGSIFAGFTVPIYDGGLRAAVLGQAEAQFDSAQAWSSHVKEDAVRQIVMADNALRTSLAAFQAAGSLAQAAQTNFNAGLSAYRNGVGSATDVTLAESQLLQARNASSDAYSGALAAAATLALASGALGTAPQ